MSPATHLAFINVFIGDIQGGLGPFLATWLAGTGEWGPGRVGLVTTIVGLATLVLSGPLGAPVDYLGRPKLLLLLACAAILAGTLAIVPARSFATVLAAQFVAAAGGTLLIPALTALTLGIVGKKGFPKQQGRNQAFNHVGILTAALLIGWGTSRFGPRRPSGCWASWRSPRSPRSCSCRLRPGTAVGPSAGTRRSRTRPSTATR